MASSCSSSNSNNNRQHFCRGIVASRDMGCRYISKEKCNANLDGTCGSARGKKCFVGASSFFVSQTKLTYFIVVIGILQKADALKCWHIGMERWDSRLSTTTRIPTVVAISCCTFRRSSERSVHRLDWQGYGVQAHRTGRGELILSKSCLT